MNADRKTLLLMPEGSVLAHVGRALAVARHLRERGDVRLHFAASGAHAYRLRQTGRPVHPVHTRPREDLLARLKAGGSAFDEATLADYVESEIRLLERLRPDAVVGDFRASLGISACVAGVPYVSVTNVVWTRYCDFPLDAPASWLPTMILGRRVMRALAPRLEGPAYRHYARPFRRVAARYGVGAPTDVRDCMCSPGLTLLADSPHLFPAAGLPEHFRFVGPVLWEPDLPAPEWLGRLDPGRPLAYVTMGSTGPLGQMRAIADALLETGCQVVCTTATSEPEAWPERRGLFAARYCPGSAISAVADVVVCHAGNGTIYQALSGGAPVVGVPEFHDQDFNMQRVEALGLGLRARPGRHLVGDVLAGVGAVLSDDAYAGRAEEMARRLAASDGAREAARAIARFAGLPADVRELAGAGRI